MRKNLIVVIVTAKRRRLLACPTTNEPPCIVGFPYPGYRPRCLAYATIRADQVPVLQVIQGRIKSTRRPTVTFSNGCHGTGKGIIVHKISRQLESVFRRCPFSKIAIEPNKKLSLRIIDIVRVVDHVSNLMQCIYDVIVCEASPRDQFLESESWVSEKSVD